MTDLTHLQTWDEWLAHPQCMGALERVARSVFRQAARIELPEGLLPCDPHGHSPLQGDDVRTLAHDLWLFLQTRSPAWREKAPLQWLASRGERFLVQKIARDYLLHLKDQARTYGTNPWRALYRQLRQLLREEESICYRATSQGAFYSLEKDARELPRDALDRAPPYDQWESPLETVPTAQLHTRDGLLKLARFFWNLAPGYFGGGRHCLPVRELVHYLGRHYAGLEAPLIRPASQEAEPDREDSLECIAKPGEELVPEHSFVRSRLRKLAEGVVNAWSGKQREAFYLLHGRELTLDAAASHMGYKGPSGVSYVYGTALDRLRDFSLLWPGLSPPDLNEDLFDEFVEEILELCKSGRDSRNR